MSKDDDDKAKREDDRREERLIESIEKELRDTTPFDLEDDESMEKYWDENG